MEQLERTLSDNQINIRFDKIFDIECWFRFCIYRKIESRFSKGLETTNKYNCHVADVRHVYLHILNIFVYVICIKI